MGNKRKKKQNNPSVKKVGVGVEFYNSLGKIYMGCGFASLLLLGFVSILPQDYEKYNIPLIYGIWFAVSAALILLGLIPIVLGKYSKKYQVWVEKEVHSFHTRNEQRQIKLGKKLMQKELSKRKK